VRAPGAELARANSQPADEAAERKLGLGGPGVDEIDEGVSRVVENPGARQGPQRAFLKATCSSISWPSTSSLRRSFASSADLLILDDFGAAPV